ncbi:MAG: hypothetical protein NVS2B7_28360 [Herpetosiphon sp.]
MDSAISWSNYPAPPNLTAVELRDPTLPLVSIVTPSYNQGHFIRETIDSVLGQDYPNIEYWVIDGGSSDQTISILREYEADPRFHWLSESDKGQSDAINKGWSRCRGEIWTWLNSDDTYLPAAISTQVKALIDHPHHGAVYGDIIFTQQDGGNGFTVYGRPYSIIELLRFTIPMQPTTFIRSSICKAIGHIDLRFHFSMDSEYWVRAARLADFWYEPQAIATYRLHPQSKTIGAHRGFAHDWQAILDTYFAGPEVPAFVKKRQASIYADLYANLGLTEIGRGSLALGFRYVVRSLGTGSIRRRLLQVAPALVDRYTSLNILTQGAQWWTKVQSKQS